LKYLSTRNAPATQLGPIAVAQLPASFDSQSSMVNCRTLFYHSIAVKRAWTNTEPRSDHWKSRVKPQNRKHPRQSSRIAWRISYAHSSILNTGLPNGRRHTRTWCSCA